MNKIKIIGSTNKSENLFFCDYSTILDKAIDNFKPARTVRVFKGICYISRVSLDYFTEILRMDNVSFTVITTLVLDK